MVSPEFPYAIDELMVFDPTANRAWDNIRESAGCFKSCTCEPDTPDPDCPIHGKKAPAVSLVPAWQNTVDQGTGLVAIAASCSWQSDDQQETAGLKIITGES